jgi:hypothetical protein
MEDQSSVSLFVKIGILVILIAITYFKPLFHSQKDSAHTIRRTAAHP